MKQIRITAKPDGTTQITVVCGIVGEGCKAMMEPFESALGGSKVAGHDLPEMYQTADAEQGQA